jgi:hypothetical protein
LAVAKLYGRRNLDPRSRPTRDGLDRHAVGITGDPYAAADDAARTAAVQSWAPVLGATWWAPHVDAGVTTLRASVKDYQGAAILLRAALFEGDSADL